MTTSRPTPPKTDSDRDMPDLSTIRKQIGDLYNNQVTIAKTATPDTPYHTLNTQEMEAIQVSLKTKQRPFAVYYEFLCPSNNHTFMPYTQGSNPFLDYDFSQPIANPLSRKHALAHPEYSKRFKAKIYPKRH